jgi:hypothetical protein
MFQRILGVAAGVVLAAAAVAQTSPVERVRITDPDRLEALGFPRDAENVFSWSPTAAESGRAAEASNRPEQPETWGGSTGYTTIPGFALQIESGYNAHLDRSSAYTHCVNGLPPISYPTYAYAPIAVFLATALGLDWPN